MIKLTQKQKGRIKEYLLTPHQDYIAKHFITKRQRKELAKTRETRALIGRECDLILNQFEKENPRYYEAKA